jgi:hypothetical protein
MGHTSPSDLRSSVNSAQIFWLKKDPPQEPNGSHPVYPVHPCLSSLRHIAFYLVNCAYESPEWEIQIAFIRLKELSVETLPG